MWDEHRSVHSLFLPYTSGEDKAPDCTINHLKIPKADFGNFRWQHTHESHQAATHTHTHARTHARTHAHTHTVICRIYDVLMYRWVKYEFCCTQMTSSLASSKFRRIPIWIKVKVKTQWYLFCVLVSKQPQSWIAGNNQLEYSLDTAHICEESVYGKRMTWSWTFFYFPTGKFSSHVWMQSIPNVNCKSLTTSVMFYYYTTN